VVPQVNPVIAPPESDTAEVPEPRLCDVVVLPYLSATQSGIAQIAFNFDRPVIATAVGGLGEVVKQGETGLVVPPGDPAALADAIRKFYGRNLGEPLSEGVRKAKQAYGWQHMTDAIEVLAAS